MALPKVSSCIHHVTYSSIANAGTVDCTFLSADTCTFQPLEKEKLCTIDVQGKNRDFENDTVLGMVSLGQKDTSFCKEQNKTTEKNVTIYKCECRNGCSLDMYP